MRLGKSGEKEMTYDELFYLKFRRGLSTYELVRRFPGELRRVSEVALLDLPEATLRDILKEDKAFNRLMRLKKKFSRFL